MLGLSDVLLLLVPQVRHWADEGAAASLLLSRTIRAKRPGMHVVHIASEMVPIAKVTSSWLAGLAPC